MTQKRRTLLAAAGIALVLPLSACSSTSEGNKNPGGSGANPVEALQLTAVQAVAKASEKSASADTFKATISVEGPAKLQATTQTQLKPTFMQSLDYQSIAAGGTGGLGGMKAVITTDTVYINMPQLSKLAGDKPWIKWKLDGEDSLGLGSLLKQADQYSPAEQTKMLTSSGDVKQVGKEDVGGVPTTRFAGTTDAVAALGKLDPETRAKLEELYKSGGITTIAFDVWIGDADQLPYKLVSNVTTSQGKVSTTMTFTDYGKPVTIQVPPADQVGDFKLPA